MHCASYGITDPCIKNVRAGINLSGGRGKVPLYPCWRVHATNAVVSEELTTATRETAWHTEDDHGADITSAGISRWHVARREGVSGMQGSQRKRSDVVRIIGAIRQDLGLLCLLCLLCPVCLLCLVETHAD